MLMSPLNVNDSNVRELSPTIACDESVQENNSLPFGLQEDGPAEPPVPLKQPKDPPMDPSPVHVEPPTMRRNVRIRSKPKRLLEQWYDYYK